MDAIDGYRTVCEQAARAAGEVLLDWAGRFSAREKGPSDLVTEADLAAQETIRERLLGAFPKHGFLAEEQNAQIPSQEDGLRWIVDPLDGTMNYVHGVPNYAVSIALEQRGRLLAGTVFDPVNRECFSAALGQGAWLNGRPLKASTASSLSQALVAASFPARVQRNDREVADFIEVTTRAQGTRRMGSSALNLCYVAAGRFDAYWSTSTKTWDIAAGALLVSEAGGVITSYDGGPLDLARPQFIAAATTNLHQELRELLHRAASG
ncbi:MAG TPA: inositol monophosphatase family protein [Pirellulales bacterium]|nr:inositol monophosphatase family protein [Pirellulales bacterium]